MKAASLADQHQIYFPTLGTDQLNCEQEHYCLVGNVMNWKSNIDHFKRTAQPNHVISSQRRHDVHPVSCNKAKQHNHGMLDGRM
jgi:hypothetical protein